MIGEAIYRIRRISARAHGPNYYHHADVISSHWTKALQAAKQGRVRNWRWIDKFDHSEIDYTEYEFLYKITDSEFAAYPIPDEQGQ